MAHQDLWERHCIGRERPLSEVIPWQIDTRTFSEINPPKWECDNSWILLLNKHVLCEPLVVKNDVWWETLTFISAQLTTGFLMGFVYKCYTILRHLRDLPVS